MKICSVTLAGPGTEAIIGDALRSVVNWVDHCLIVKTGAWREFDAAIPWEKALIDALPWVNDFAITRNGALESAAHLRFPCDWALMLDTDERMICENPAALRDLLANVPDSVSAVSCADVAGNYSKERLFRLPLKGQFVGPTHEYWRPDDGCTIGHTKLLTFSELPNEGEARQAKLDRDRHTLEKLVRARGKNPDRARWCFYLGLTHHNLGNDANALLWWKQAVAAEGGGWEEMRAWAAFRAAKQEGETAPHRAIDTCLHGLRCYPQMPELHTVIAAAYLDLDEPSKALTWAHLALACGQMPPVTRSGYVWRPAWHDIPLDIIRTAAEQMGLIAEDADPISP
jgi:hypothetical protein